VTIATPAYRRNGDRAGSDWAYSSNSPKPSCTRRSRRVCIPRSNSLRAASFRGAAVLADFTWREPLQMQGYRFAPAFRQLRQTSRDASKILHTASVLLGSGAVFDQCRSAFIGLVGKASAGRELAARMASITVDSTTLCI